jgi:hypothetical protein
VIARLRRAVAAGQPRIQLMAVGHSHTSHVVCLEEGRLRLRVWVLDPEKGRAFLASHGRFMPEDAEQISEPGPVVLVDVATVDELIARLVADGLI